MRARVGREPTLTGSVTLSDLVSSAPVTLPVGYPTASYTVMFGAVITLLGIPLPGALTANATSQTANGFTVTLDAAPGLGASVSVPYTVTP